MTANIANDDARLRYEIRLSLRGQGELDPIEAWLKLNAKAPWKMEFQGMSKQPGPSSASRLIVVYRFADQEDAARFQKERRLMVPASAPAPTPASVPKAAPTVAAKVSRTISEVFTAPKKAAPSRPSRRPAARPQSAADPGDSDDFMKCAGDLVRNVDQVMASKVQLIGLERVKEHFGDAWARVADRADQVAERAILKRLTQQDMMTKVHALNYLVLFAGVTQEEAQLRCRMIANEIARQLIGEEGSGELLSVKTGVTPVDGEALFEDTPSLEELSSRLAADDSHAEGAAATPKAASEPSEPVDPLAKVEFVYRPMWDVRHKVVTAFLCLPAVRLSSGQRLVGENAIVGIDTEETKRALDLRILKRATDDLSTAFNAGKKLLMAVPVHFDTISMASRRLEFLNECRHLSPMAAKLILFEIVGAPEGVPHGRLLELTTALRTRARAVMIRTPIWSANWGELAQAGIIAIGADLSQERASETVLVERFVKFAADADKRKLGSYLHGLRSLSLTVSAVGAGFHYLSGQPIANLAEAPPEAHRFNLTDLYDTMASDG